MSSTTDERRKKIRYPRRLPARYGTDAKMCGGTVLDISEGGLRIESNEPFSPNAVIHVFVQFPRHTVRLRARVIWSGAAREGGSPVMGLAFTQPEPTLAKSYKEWCAEVKQLATQPDGEETAAAPPDDAAAPQEPEPAPAAAPRSAAAPQEPEPRSPVKRRLESRQGHTYDALFEKIAGGWELRIAQVPRQLGVDAPDYQDTFPDYASANQAFRAFVRDH